MRLKDAVLAECFAPDGRYDRARFGPHTHSTTCVMSSLAQLADLLGDAPLMARVEAFYARGLWDIRDQLGWVIESSAPDAPPDRGEVNNTGDIVETALILGRWGWTEAYDDVERILRGHLLPSQLRDVDWIVERPDAGGGDGRRAVAQRLVGAFGFPAPYGHRPLGLPRVSFNLDIVGGAAASLCEVVRSLGAAGPGRAGGHCVDLYFDHRSGAVTVESPYTAGALTVTVHRPGPLFVRVPGWSGPERVSVGGAPAPRGHGGRYLLLDDPPLHQRITFRLDLPTSGIVLRHRTRGIRARLRGDEVTAMDAFGQELAFFDPIA